MSAAVAPALAAQSPATGTLTVVVHDDDGRPVAQAEVRAGSARGTTDEQGLVTLRVPAGQIDVIATREGRDPAAASITVPEDGAFTTEGAEKFE